MSRMPDRPDGEILALLVDDDVELGELLQDALDEHGIRIEVAHDGRRGLSRALSGEHDLILLDGMLPGLDGLELLRLVRRQSRVPVIMLTARTAPSDQVAGLDAGADDYLPKPFGTDLLLARIRAVLRRTGGREAGERDGSGRVPGPDVRAREALVDGSPVALTASSMTSSNISSGPPAGSCRAVS